LSYNADGNGAGHAVPIAIIDQRPAVFDPADIMVG
jgi:hypothetical protein